jgi:hypothetical protein
MDLGEGLTRWTIRGALALYVLSLAIRLAARGRCVWLAPARWAWTFGCVLFTIHVLCAFHFYHSWSHDAAYAATAERTAEVVGLSWGGGLFANYLFLVVWAADAGWWWTAPKRYECRSRLAEWAVQGFLGFMAFHATVVFGQGLIRWFGVAACVVLAAWTAALRYNRRSATEHPPGTGPASPAETSRPV